MARDPQEYVFQRRRHGAKVAHLDAMLGNASDDLRYQADIDTTDRQAPAFADHFAHRLQFAQPLCRTRVARLEDDRAFRTVPIDQRPRRPDVDDPAVVDDRHAIAQPLRLLHEMRRQEDGLAAVTDATYEVPDGMPRLPVQAGRQPVGEAD